ncbi:MAG: ABC transporter substrate-binding protein [Xanthobacteraceae bacterium]|nr:ABC transporter substrate-binding protein [Xanthobacteraceae bacterium]
MRNWLARLCAAAGALLAVTTAAPAADVVKVGLIADFTGAFANWGSQFQQAVEAFQAVHGKTVKGPDGKDIEIQFVYRDNASAGPDKTKQLAEELVLRERVKFLAGFDLSPHAMAVADIATQAKIPVIIMNAATASITRGSPYYVRVSMTIPQYVSPLPKWAYDHGIHKVYMLVSDYAPGYDAETYFAKGFKAVGGEIVGSERMPQQETNYAAYMERVLQAKPDALFMFLPAGAPSIAFVKAYTERGLKTAGIKLLGTGETQELLLPNFTDDVIGAVSAFHYTETNTNPENIALKEQLVKMFGPKTTPDIASVAAWDGTDLIYQAVAALGANADGLKYVDFMKGKKLNSPRGPIYIDPDERDVVQNIYVREVQKRDGKLVNIDVDKVDMVKDPWKIDNPPKGK